MVGAQSDTRTSTFQYGAQELLRCLSSSRLTTEEALNSLGAAEE